MSGIEKRLTITDGAPSSRQHMELDGIDISNAVRGYTIHGQAGQLPEVTLDVLAVELEIEGEPARIHISEECRDLLRRFGWTPPGRPDKPPKPNVDPQVIRDAGYNPVQIGLNPDVAPLYAPGSKLPPEGA